MLEVDAAVQPERVAVGGVESLGTGWCCAANDDAEEVVEAVADAEDVPLLCGDDEEDEVVLDGGDDADAGASDEAVKDEVPGEEEFGDDAGDDNDDGGESKGSGARADADDVMAPLRGDTVVLEVVE